MADVEEATGAAQVATPEEPAGVDDDAGTAEDLQDLSPDSRSTREEEQTIKKKKRMMKFFQNAILNDGHSEGGIHGFTVPNASILHPDGSTKKIQDFVVIVVLVVYALVLPYRWAFNRPPQGLQMLFDFICEPLLLIDLIMRFRTGFFEERGKLIIEPALLYKHYLKRGAAIDIVSALPMELLTKLLIVALVSSTDTESSPSVYTSDYPDGNGWAVWAAFLHMNQFTRVLRAYGNLSYIENAVFSVMSTAAGLFHVGFDYSTSRIIKLFIVVALLAHWVACLWYWIGKKDEGWVDVYGFELCKVANCTSTNSAWKTYTASYFYVFTTITTVGYGDFSPQTSGERYFGILLMLLGCTIFAYVVGLLSGSISGFDIFNMECQQAENYLDALMSKYRVRADVKRSISAYYQHIRVHSEVYAKVNILRSLPYHLRRDLTLELYSGLDISTMSIIMKDTSRDLHYALLTYMKPTIVEGHNIKICVRGEKCADLFFLHTGDVNVIFDTGCLEPGLHPETPEGSDDEDDDDATTKLTIDHVKPSSCFGEECALGAPRYIFDVVASHRAELFFIDRQDFDEVFREFPDEFEGVVERVMTRIKNLFMRLTIMHQTYAGGMDVMDVEGELADCPEYEQEMASIRYRRPQISKITDQLTEMQGRLSFLKAIDKRIKS